MNCARSRQRDLEAHQDASVEIVIITVGLRHTTLHYASISEVFSTECRLKTNPQLSIRSSGVGEFIVTMGTPHVNVVGQPTQTSRWADRTGPSTRSLSQRTCLANHRISSVDSYKYRRSPRAIRHCGPCIDNGRMRRTFLLECRQLAIIMLPDHVQAQKSCVVVSPVEPFYQTLVHCLTGQSFDI